MFQISSLFIDEFFIPKVCAKFSVMIKVNKGDFCEKLIQELNSTLFVKNEDFCRLKFQSILKIWVCYYHMTISLFSVKVKISSLLIHRTNPRRNTWSFWSFYGQFLFHCHFILSFEDMKVRQYIYFTRTFRGY